MPLTKSTPRLLYDVAGERGSPVLLVMGFAMRGIVWRPQIEALRERHRVVWFDNRGIGGSDPFRGPTTIKRMARDVLRLADELGLDGIHLAGVSMGGMLAQEAALAAPDRFASLTLIATHAGGPTTWVPPTKGLRRFVATSLARTPEARARALTALLYPREFVARIDRAALEAHMRDRVATPAPRATILGQLGAVLAHRAHERLHELRVPTLVVRAGRDILIHPRESDRLLRLVPNAELADFPDAGHGVIFQRAPDLAARMLAHFAKHG